MVSYVLIITLCHLLDRGEIFGSNRHREVGDKVTRVGDADEVTEEEPPALQHPPA